MPSAVPRPSATDRQARDWALLRVVRLGGAQLVVARTSMPSGHEAPVE
jgi:hypothetical protein